MVPPKFPCISCNKNVGNVDSVQCIICELWMHKNCGITDEEYELTRKLDKEKSDGVQAGFSWICICCRRYAEKNNEEIKKLKMTVKQKDDDFTKLRDEFIDLKNKFVELQNGFVTVKKAVDENKTVVCNIESSNVKTVMNEMIDQESRHFNVICHNVRESTSINVEERKTFDLSCAIKMLNHMDIGHVERRNIATVKRIGRRNNDKPRPLMIVFYDKQLSENALKNKQRLDGIWKEIRLVPDLTNYQRQHDKDIQEEVSKKNLERTEEDALNFEFRAVGQKGKKKIIQTRITERRERPYLRAHVDAEMQRRRVSGYTIPMLEDL